MPGENIFPESAMFGLAQERLLSGFIDDKSGIILVR
jgi:hypothetical protein